MRHGLTACSNYAVNAKEGVGGRVLIGSLQGGSERSSVG